MVQRPSLISDTPAMIREARPEDFAHIRRLYRQLHPDEPTVQDGSGEAVFKTILDSSWLHLFVVELDGTIAATTYLNVIPNITHAATPYAVIQNVVVEEGRRGTGLGKAIMEHTLRAQRGTLAATRPNSQLAHATRPRTRSAAPADSLPRREPLTTSGRPDSRRDRDLDYSPRVERAS